MSTLSKKEKKIFEDLYKKTKKEIVKTINECDDIFDLITWFQIIPLMMSAISVYKIPGNKKSDIIIEIICQVIQNDIKVDNKEKIITNVRKKLPGIINGIVLFSKTVNFKKLFKKLYKVLKRGCCLC